MFYFLFGTSQLFVVIDFSIYHWAFYYVQNILILVKKVDTNKTYLAAFAVQIIDPNFFIKNVFISHKKYIFIKINSIEQFRLKLKLMCSQIHNFHSLNFFFSLDKAKIVFSTLKMRKQLLKQNIY